MSTDAPTAFAVTQGETPHETFSISRAPARWSSGRVPVIYASANAAAALLEYHAHLQSSPVHVLRLARMALPTGDFHDITPDEDLQWRERPYREDVQALGDGWLQRADSLVARVPSVLCPCEFNLLINPAHPDFARARYLPGIEFRLDQRLL